MSKKKRKSKAVVWVFIAMGAGILISLIALVLGIIDAARQETTNSLSIISLTISSVAAVLSFVLSGVATYLSEKSSKQTEETLNKMEGAFEKYINYIAVNSLKVNEENVSGIIDSYTNKENNGSHVTPISQ